QTCALPIYAHRNGTTTATHCTALARQLQRRTTRLDRDEVLSRLKIETRRIRVVFATRTHVPRVGVRIVVRQRGHQKGRMLRCVDVPDLRQWYRRAVYVGHRPITPVLWPTLIWTLEHACERPTLA